jgi:cleavage and polyadenylation specificity factor subunit 3
LKVLVHGEANEMGRLKAALIREYEDDPEYNIDIFNPRNTEPVQLYFRGEKMAKVFSHWFGCKPSSSNVFIQVVGSLATDRPKHGQHLSGILVKRNFNYHIMSPSDINSKHWNSVIAFMQLYCLDYTELAMSTVTQRMSIYYTGSLAQLHLHLSQLTTDLKVLPTTDGNSRGLKIFKEVLMVHSRNMITLEVGCNSIIYCSLLVSILLNSIFQWTASPVNDMYADAVMAIVLKAENEQMKDKSADFMLSVLPTSQFFFHFSSSSALCC